MQKLGTRPPSFISGKICFEFSVQCSQRYLSIVSTYSYIKLRRGELVVLPVLAKKARTFLCLEICPVSAFAKMRIQLFVLATQAGSTHRVPTPQPPSSTLGKAGRNHLNEEITPLLPTGIGERFSHTISNLGHAALLRRCELPL